MAEARKSFLLRMNPELWEEINRLAQAELRSVNAQIEFMLREHIKKRRPNAPTATPTSEPPREADA